MIIDPQIIDALEGFGTGPWEGRVYRHCFAGRDPLAPSHAGGRWAPGGEFAVPVLYTSLAREGAITEGNHVIAQYSIPPSKGRRVCTIDVKLIKVVDLSSHDRLTRLGVNIASYAEDWGRCPEIGAAANFLQLQGILALSARFNCCNLVILTDQLDVSCSLDVIDEEQLPPAGYH